METTPPYGSVKRNHLWHRARAYGITTDQLIEWNPQARDGIRKDQVLIVSDPTYRPATLAVAIPARLSRQLPF